MKSQILKLSNKFCKELKITICFSLFKTGSLFSVKDVITHDQQSFVVYSFNCPGCNARYIGETTRQLLFRVDEHLSTDKQSYIFKHLNNNPNCQELSNISCFKIIDHAQSEYVLKIKEAMHIEWLKPNLNKQKKHVTLNLPV